MAWDWTWICREMLNGEGWEQGFERPNIPGLTELMRATAAIHVAPDGRPVFRLRWLPDVKVRRHGWKEPIYRDLLYLTKVPFAEFYDDKRKLYVNKFATAQVPVPRFGFEQYIPDAVGRPEWEAQRFEWKGGERIDWVGDYPKTGWYKAVPGDLGMLGHHDTDMMGELHVCCYQAMIAGEGACYGVFRKPTISDVNQLRESFTMFMNAPAKDRPDEATSEETKAAYAAGLIAEQGAALARRRAETIEDAKHEAASSIDIFSDIGGAALKAASRQGQRV